MTPIAVTSLLTEATRTGSSIVTRRPDWRSAMPSAKLATSPLRSNATPTSACTGGSAGGGSVAQLVTDVTMSILINRQAVITRKRSDEAIHEKGWIASLRSQ